MGNDWPATSTSGGRRSMTSSTSSSRCRPTSGTRPPTCPAGTCTTSPPTSPTSRRCWRARRRRPSRSASPPTDATARPERIFGGVPWDWERLLRNRPLDVWMHEQDVRRAVDLPGGMDSAGARHTAAYLAERLGVVLAKRVGAPAGTTAVLEVGGQPPVAFAVTDAGRGVPLPTLPADPTVCLRLEREAFVVLAGGRREPEAGSVEVS